MRERRPIDPSTLRQRIVLQELVLWWLIPAAIAIAAALLYPWIARVLH